MSGSGDECRHYAFNAVARINRIEEHDGRVLHVEIKISCVQCGALAQFVGLPHGVSFYRPTMSLDRFSLLAPATVGGAMMPAGLPSFGVQVLHDGSHPQ